MTITWFEDLEFKPFTFQQAQQSSVDSALSSEFLFNNDGNDDGGEEAAQAALSQTPSPPATSLRAELCAAEDDFDYFGSSPQQQDMFEALHFPLRKSDYTRPPSSKPPTGQSVHSRFPGKHTLPALPKQFNSQHTAASAYKNSNSLFSSSLQDDPLGAVMRRQNKQQHHHHQPPNETSIAVGQMVAANRGDLREQHHDTNVAGDDDDSSCGFDTAAILLDTQVLSECIRNLEHHHSGSSSSSSKGPAQIHKFGASHSAAQQQHHHEAHTHHLSQFQTHHHNHHHQPNNNSTSSNYCANCSKTLLVGSLASSKSCGAPAAAVQSPASSSKVLFKCPGGKSSAAALGAKQIFPSLAPTMDVAQPGGQPSHSHVNANISVNALLAQATANKHFTFCTFCKNNGESEAIYSTHYLKDAQGTVTCPILRAYTCPICGQNGDHAHTVKYCPVAARLTPKDAPVRSEMRVLRTARTSAGRRRFF